MMEGYKDSPLGKIPSDWEVFSIDEYADVTKLAGYEFTEYIEYVEDGEIIALRALNVKNGKLVLKDIKRIKKEVSENLLRSKLYIDDIVFTYVGTIGEVAIIRENDKFHLAPNIAKITIREKKNPDYLCQYLRSPLIASEINKLLTTTSQPALSMGNIRKLKTIFPPLPEQQKIAEILSTVDAKIEVIDQQITETQALKKGLIQQLLTGKLSVIEKRPLSPAEMKDSPLGEIPKSWEVVKLSDVCDKIGDGIHSTPKYVDSSKYYFVNGNNLVNGTLTIFEKTKCVSKEEYDKLKIKLNKNTVLMSINGTIGNLALYQNEEVIFGKSASYISVNEDVFHYLYLYYFLQHSTTKKYFFDELTGSTIQNLSLKTIRNTPTLLPSISEQKQIADILSSVDEKLEVLYEKKTYYQELKQGLMQQLLTGKLRVPQLPNEKTHN